MTLPAESDRELSQRVRKDDREAFAFPTTDLEREVVKKASRGVTARLPCEAVRLWKMLRRVCSSSSHLAHAPGKAQEFVSAAAASSASITTGGSVPRAPAQESGACTSSYQFKPWGDEADSTDMSFVRFVFRNRRWFLIPSLIVFALQVLFLLVSFRYEPRPRAKDCVSVVRHSVCAQTGRLPKAAAADTVSHADPLYERVVVALSGRSVPVYCWSQADWSKRLAERKARWPEAEPLGRWSAYTHLADRSVNLSPEVCAELARLVSDPDPVWEADDVDALAWSAHVLAHESVHVQGVLSQAVAECRGLQTTARAVVELGRSKEEAAYLATVYWKHLYLLLGDDFHSPECHEGGALDVRMSTRWP
jgi:hypothetical protein